MTNSCEHFKYFEWNVGPKINMHRTEGAKKVINEIIKYMELKILFKLFLFLSFSLIGFKIINKHFH